MEDWESMVAVTLEFLGVGFWYQGRSVSPPQPEKPVIASCFHSQEQEVKLLANPCANPSTQKWTRDALFLLVVVVVVVLPFTPSPLSMINSVCISPCLWSPYHQESFHFSGWDTSHNLNPMNSSHVAQWWASHSIGPKVPKSNNLCEINLIHFSTNDCDGKVFQNYFDIFPNSNAIKPYVKTWKRVDIIPFKLFIWYNLML